MNFDQDTAWPPAHLATVTAPITTWAAWYEGNPDKLANLYAATPNQARPSQLAGGLVGGLVGRVARWFWGQPTPAGQMRSKTHVPIARDIARASAVLLFGEELQLAAPTDGNLDRLQVILDGNRWQSLLPEAAEFCAALGGVYLRCGWDTEVAQHPLISIVQPDGALPVFRWGRLVEVVFWQTVRREGASVWRHLETHKPGRIEHALYQGTATHLGTLVPLDESDQTVGLPVNDEAAILTGTDLLTACYIPNVRPAPLWRDDPVGQHLGCSDFAGLEPRMDELDEAWSNLRREQRLNRSRIMAASALLESAGPGQGASFDLDREVFVSVQAPADASGLPITVAASTLSVADRLSAIEALTRDIYLDAGYSPASFGMDDGTAVTATEVGARERKTMSTREMKTRYWTPALEGFLEAVTAVDEFVFHGGPRVRPAVTFPASVSPTIGEVAQSVQLLNNAQAASVETRVKMVHPDWDQPEVDAEVQRIMAEQAMTTPSFDLPEDLSGGGSVMDAQDLKAKYDALGVAVRAGVDPQDAASQLGLNVRFTGAVPVSLRLPESDAASLEQT